MSRRLRRQLTLGALLAAAILLTLHETAQDGVATASVGRIEQTAVRLHATVHAARPSPPLHKVDLPNPMPASSCQAALDAGVAADAAAPACSSGACINLALSVDRLLSACTCASASHPTSPPALVVPAMVWTEARTASFKRWYRLVFVGPAAGARAPNGGLLASGGAVYGPVASLDSLSSNARAGALAARGGILVASTVDYAPAFVYALNTEAACSLLACGRDAATAASPACDSNSTWAPGYAVEGTLPIHTAYPHRAAALRPQAGLTGSPTWDAVALLSEACGSGVTNPTTQHLSTLPWTAPPWFNYSCLVRGQEALTLANAPTFQVPQPVRQTNMTSAILPSKRSGDVSHAVLWEHVTAHVLEPTYSSKYRPELKGLRNISGPALKCFMRTCDPLQSVSDSFITLVDVSVIHSQGRLLLLRQSKRGGTGGGGPRPTYDMLQICNCEKAGFEVPSGNISAWHDAQINHVKFPSSGFAGEGKAPPLRFAVAIGSAWEHNYYHALAEGLQTLWTTLPFASSPRGDRGIAYLGAGSGVVKSIANSSGLQFLKSWPRGSLPDLLNPPLLSMEDGAVPVEALLVQGASCTWPGVLNSLLSREALREIGGIGPPDMRPYWPPTVAGAPSTAARVVAAAAAAATGLCAQHPRQSAPLPMSPASQAYGCPRALARRPRILVVRRKLRGLEPANETALVAAIQALGGEPIVEVFSDVTRPALPPRGQWALFGATDILIGPHGAASTNLLAANAGAGSLEWAQPVKPFFFGWLAGLLGLRWDYWEDMPNANTGDRWPTTGAVRVNDFPGAMRAYCALLAAQLTVEACDEELAQS